MNNVGSFEIVQYDFQLVNGQPKIVISMVKVLDTDGNYIKFAKLREVLPAWKSRQTRITGRAHN